MFDKLLIANRGEIALRVQRTCRELGVRNVCVFSEIDRESKHVKLADEAVCIGPANAAASYLNSAAIISAAEITDAEAVHPGYGFLSENADFAEQVERSGFTFIGPRPETIRMMGDKITAKSAAAKAGLTIVPGTNLGGTDNMDAICEKVSSIGYPVILKSAAGGGGRGMRAVHTEAMLRNCVSMLSTESVRSFGDGTLYAERLMAAARHIEVQVIADQHGNTLHLGTRDCSVQRRHQKIIEEAPAPLLPVKALAKLGVAVAEACGKIGYVGAGTMEFLYDRGKFHFIEMNTRLQVEHPVTELVTGLDMVELQLMMACGEKLPVRQKDIVLTGHAIECRINAEDPSTLVPSPGRITSYHTAGGLGVRVDSHVYSGCEIPHNYDSLIGKLIVHGRDRTQAVLRMRSALSEFIIGGIKTNLPLHRRILADHAFATGGVGIDYLESLQ